MQDFPTSSLYSLTNHKTGQHLARHDVQNADHDQSSSKVHASVATPWKLSGINLPLMPFLESCESDQRLSAQRPRLHTKGAVGRLKTIVLAMQWQRRRSLEHGKSINEVREKCPWKQSNLDPSCSSTAWRSDWHDIVSIRKLHQRPLWLCPSSGSLL